MGANETVIIPPHSKGPSTRIMRPPPPSDATMRATSTRRQRGSDDTEGSKSAPAPVMLYAGVGGGVMVAVIVAAVLLSGGKTDKIASAEAPTKKSESRELKDESPQAAAPSAEKDQRLLLEQTKPLPETNSKNQALDRIETAKASVPPTAPVETAKTAEPAERAELRQNAEKLNREKDTDTSTKTEKLAAAPEGLDKPPAAAAKPTEDVSKMLGAKDSNKGGDVEDTPDKVAPVDKEKDKTAARRANPFDAKPSIIDADPKTNNGMVSKPADAAGPAKARPKPAFVRGKPSDLFADVTSRVDEVPDPRNNGKSKMKIDKLDGWNLSSNDAQGFNVKDGILSITKQAALQLDGFPSIEYKLSFEVELGNNTALALLTGANVAISNLLIVTDTHAMPGTWDSSAKDKNIAGDNKLAKPHGAKGGWISVQVSVHPNSIDCVFENKPPVHIALPKTATFPQMGFMTLGVKNNANPSLKIRKATLIAP